MKIKMGPPEDQLKPTSPPASYPDTAESGDAYDIDILTEPIPKTRSMGFRSVSLGALLRLLDNAESGEAFDAEVEQSFQEELEDWSARQTVPEA
jgi:hypothetical protein